MVTLIIENYPSRRRGLVAPRATSLSETTAYYTTKTVGRRKVSGTNAVQLSRK
jgi:hypothetical protein